MIRGKDGRNIMTIAQYIDKYLPQTICCNKEDKGTLIGLPHPYIVPCASGSFQEMYYWDTYFTHKGLLIRREFEQVRNDIDNMCYLIQKYGFMPNGNRTNYLYNSQPPFLSMMIRDYYDITEDEKWLSETYEVLKKEYHFWERNRKSTIGLNHYDCHPMPEEMIRSAAQVFRERTGLYADYPNGWAPMQLIVIGGLFRYGYCKEACRIAKKFKDTVERCYDTTGHLWEKYNMAEGNVNVQNEYEMPAMLGWTFGVYTWVTDFLRQNQE